MVREIYTDIFNVECDIICHQVNCQKKMGLGIAKSITTRWLEVLFDYIGFCEQFKTDKELLGKCLVTEILNPEKYGPLYIANLFGQRYYGSGERYTEYDALETSFNELKKWIMENISKEHVIVAIPFKIGCGLAGGDWNVVLDIIKRVFDNENKIEVVICNNLSK